MTELATSPPRVKSAPWRGVNLRREAGMFAALLVLCLGLWLANRDFLGQSNTVNTTRQIAMLGIFSIGIGFVIITGGIDLSVGSIVGLTGVLLAKMSAPYNAAMPAAGGLGLPLWMGISIALGVALLIGLAQGLLITRLSLQPFIVTLGGMLLIRGIAQTIVRGGSLSVSLIEAGNGYFRDLSDSGLLQVGGDPLISYPVLIFLIVIVLAGYLLHFTVFGRYVYAIGATARRRRTRASPSSASRRSRT